MNEKQPVKDATIAQLVTVSLRLAMEVSVLRDRLRSQEALLAQAGLLTAGSIDAHQPDAAQLAEGDAFRRQLIEGLAADLGAGVSLQV
jgi:hypothetical protein